MQLGKGYVHVGKRTSRKRSSNETVKQDVKIKESDKTVLKLFISTKKIVVVSAKL